MGLFPDLVIRIPVRIRRLDKGSKEILLKYYKYLNAMFFGIVNEFHEIEELYYKAIKDNTYKSIAKGTIKTALLNEISKKKERVKSLTKLIEVMVEKLTMALEERGVNLAQAEEHINKENIPTQEELLRQQRDLLRDLDKGRLRQK